MPNINFSAPVIRLGTTAPSKDGPLGGGGVRGANADALGARRGLGSMERGPGGEGVRQGAALVAPTREEIMRTIFIGKIPPAVSDDDVYSILKAAGSIRRWNRAFDSNDKPCSFGFAEYEDAESLETAAEVLQDIEVPAKKIEPKKDQNGDKEPKEVEKVKLLVRQFWLSWCLLIITRSKWMMPRANTPRSGARSAEKTRLRYSFESTRPKRTSPAPSPDSSTRQTGSLTTSSCATWRHPTP
jgi:RNA recognition motif-containing protein